MKHILLWRIDRRTSKSLPISSGQTLPLILGGIPLAHNSRTRWDLLTESHLGSTCSFHCMVFSVNSLCLWRASCCRAKFCCSLVFMAARSASTRRLLSAVEYDSLLPLLPLFLPPPSILFLICRGLIVVIKSVTWPLWLLFQMLFKVSKM